MQKKARQFWGKKSCEVWKHIFCYGKEQFCSKVEQLVLEIGKRIKKMTIQIW